MREPLHRRGFSFYLGCMRGKILFLIIGVVLGVILGWALRSPATYIEQNEMLLKRADSLSWVARQLDSSYQKTLLAKMLSDRRYDSVLIHTPTPRNAYTRGLNEAHYLPDSDLLWYLKKRYVLPPADTLRRLAHP